MANLTEYLQNQGVRFIWSAENSVWISNSKEISAIQIEGNTIEADEYVLAAGSWSSKMARRLGIHIPIQAGRGYSLTLKNPARSPEISCLLMEARVAVTPLDSTLRFAGTMEIAGLNSKPNPTRFRNILKAIPDYFPQLIHRDFQDTEVWSGMRPCSPDGLPYVGRTKRYSNFSIAAGHAMMGLALGPITGKIMASILSDEDPQLDLHLLNPERFS